MTLRHLTAALLLCALSAQGFAEKVVLGKLGQVTEATKIYSRPSDSSRVYYRIKAYEYVVIKPDNTQWFKVLLQNGRYGYVEAGAVAKLPYEVTANRGSRNSYRSYPSFSMSDAPSGGA